MRVARLDSAGHDRPGRDASGSHHCVINFRAEELGSERFFIPLQLLPSTWLGGAQYIHATLHAGFRDLHRLAHEPQFVLSFRFTRRPEKSVRYH